MSAKPSDRASELMSTVDEAHAKLKRAWRSRPDGDLQTGRPETGRISSSRIPDPASDSAYAIERTRTDVLARVTDLTAELADAVDADQALAFRSRRLDDVLALHRQWAGQLFTDIRRLEKQPSGWDDAKSLTSTLAFHAQQLHRTSLWAYGSLAQPDAPKGLRVCDDERCQSPAHENSLLCRLHIERQQRWLEKAEQRRRQVRADRENGLRCRGEIRDCEAMLTDRERANGRRNCSQCRTPRCAAEIRTDCTRPLTDDDIDRNATNCNTCRKWDHDERKRQAKRDAERASDGAVAFRWNAV